MAKHSTIYFAKEALDLISDPSHASFQQVYRILLMGNVPVEVESKKAKHQVEKQGGRFKAGSTAYTLKLDTHLFTLAELRTMMNTINAVTSDIIEVINYPMFISILDGDYNNNTKAYLPNSRIVVLDENGEPTGDPDIEVKWNDYKDSTHNHRPNSGSMHIPLNSNNGGYECAVSIGIRLLEETPAYTVTEMNKDTFPTRDV